MDDAGGATRTGGAGDYNQAKASIAEYTAIQYGSELMKSHLEKKREEQEVVLRRQAVALSSSPKGTLINCNTQGVVRVNTSLNTVSFACPSLGNVSLQALQKNKWKLNSTERIQAADAGSLTRDDYDNNWNGVGVIISIMVEKQ